MWLCGCVTWICLVLHHGPIFNMSLNFNINLIFNLTPQSTKKIWAPSKVLSSSWIIKTHSHIQKNMPRYGPISRLLAVRPLPLSVPQTSRQGNSQSRWGPDPSECPKRGALGRLYFWRGDTSHPSIDLFRGWPLDPLICNLEATVFPPRSFRSIKDSAWPQGPNGSCEPSSAWGSLGMGERVTKWRSVSLEDGKKLNSQQTKIHPGSNIITTLVQHSTSLSWQGIL